MMSKIKTVISIINNFNKPPENSHIFLLHHQLSTAGPLLLHTIKLELFLLPPN